jgi:DHA2 family multidrug resistance protein
MLTGGILLVLAAAVRRMLQPNPTLKLSFLNRRNIVILALSIFVFKFGHLATIILIPGFLANIQQYRPLQTGHALAWVALPMFAVVWLVAIVALYTTSRLTLALGLTVVAIGCWICAHLDIQWAGTSFEAVEVLLAAGFGCTYVGLVSGIVLEGLEAGALSSAATAATFSGFMHFIRIFGGQTGVAVMTRFISVREKFHSNLLGLHLQSGWLTDERLRLLSGGLFSASAGPDEAQYRAIGILSQQVRAQAYTMATADGFILAAWVAAAYLLLMLFLRPARISYQDLRKMQ